MLPLMILGLLGAAAPAGESAEGFYRRMAEKLMKARTLRIKARVGFEGDHLGESPAVLRLDRDARRLRYERTMIPGRMESDHRVICDGSRLRGFHWNGPDLEIAENFSQEVIRVLLLWGMPEGIERLSGLANLSGLALEDFRMVRREKIDSRSTACISFVRSVTFNQPGAGGTWRREITFWIDEDTFLPVRRVERHSGKCLAWTVTEQFEPAAFDEEMPPERFKLPE